MYRLKYFAYLLLPAVGSAPIVHRRKPEKLPDAKLTSTVLQLQPQHMLQNSIHYRTNGNVVVFSGQITGVLLGYLFLLNVIFFLLVLQNVYAKAFM